MTKEQFKHRRESDTRWWWITFNDVAKCAIAWWVSSRPYTVNMHLVLYWVLCSAWCIDAEKYNPKYFDDENGY